MTTSHGKQLKKTAKHSAIYATGTIIRRLTGLVMLPIYTRYLTPEDYGVVELLTMAIEITGILIGLRISQVMFRYYIMAESEVRKREVVSTVLFTVIASSIIGAMVLFISAENLTRFIFGSLDYLFEFKLYILILITNAITAVGLSFVRAQQKPTLFLTISLGSLILQVGMNLLFVVMYEMHVVGVVYGALVTGIVLSTSLAAYMIFKVGVHYSYALAAELLRFVAPLMMASVATFYVSYADKYFIRVFGSLEEVGLYSLALRLSAIMSTIFEAFNMSWGADRFEVVKDKNAKVIFDKVFRFFSAGLILTGSGLILFANDFFRVMTNPAFYTASYIMPLLVLAALARTYVVYCNFGALYGKRTGILAIASWIKLIVATIGYLALVPVFGVYGAAGTLAFSVVIEMLWVYFKSKNVYDMGLHWKPVIYLLLVASVCVYAGLMVPEGELLYFFMRAMLFIVLVLIFYIMPVWEDDDRRLVKAALHKAINFARRR